MKCNKIFEFLKLYNIEFDLYEHPQFFTVEDGKDFIREGANSKNLFVKDKRGNFFLISILAQKRVNLNALSKIYARDRFSFASEEQLLELLDLTPGSVTPYGLINDQENKVRFLLDQEFLQHAKLNFHPLQNNMTISVKKEDFLKYCDLVNHKAEIIEMPCL